MSNYYSDYGQGIKVLFHDANTNSGIDNAIRLGIYLFPLEEQLIFAPPFIQPDDVVYDIGAYTGTHSILFSLWRAKVYAFEPSIYNYPRLVKNCEPFKQIKCFDVAFNDKEYDVVTQFKDCNNSLPDNNDIKQPIKYKIFDKFIKENNLPVPDFIKIDIEGMETILFKTFGNLLKENKTIIYVERHRKPKESRDIQHYADNPNWRFVDEGGYDFNDLKQYDCEFYNLGGKGLFKKLNNDVDFNELDESLVIIPKWRANVVKESRFIVT